VPRIVISIYDDPGNPHYGGGGAVVVHELAKRLADTFEVTVLAGSYRGSRGRREGRVRLRYLPVGWAGARGGQLLYHALLPFASALIRHDLWIDSFTPPFSTSVLPLVSRSPVIGLVQMLSGEDMTAKYRLPFDRIERRGLRLYRNLVVLNDADRMLVARHNPRARVWVINNGVQVPLHDRTAIGRGEYMLFLGRIDVRQKGLDLLLAAHAKAQTGLPLVIAGSGPPREVAALRALVGQRDDVRVVGRVTGRDKEELLRGCVFLVMPSRFETFGLCAIEAMSYGKPVVHFDLPRLRWIPAECAIRVPDVDADALAVALSELAESREQRTARGRRARAEAEQYDWGVMAARYRTVIDSVLGMG